MNENPSDHTPSSFPDDPEALSEMSFPASDPPSTSQPTIGGSSVDDTTADDGRDGGSTAEDGPDDDGTRPRPGVEK
jgi:hypothetical protein